MVAPFIDEVKRLPKPQIWMVGAIALAIGMLIYSYYVIIDLYYIPRWGHEDGYYSHAYLVPILAVAILWMRRDRLKELGADMTIYSLFAGIVAFVIAFALIHAREYQSLGSPNYKPEFYETYGVPLLLAVCTAMLTLLYVEKPKPNYWGLGILALAVAARAVGHWGNSFWTPSMALPLFIIGAMMLLYGWQITKVLMFPILFLYFMVPLPSWIFDEVTHPIQVWSTDASVTILKFFYSVTRTGEIKFLMPSMYELGVGVECSGFKMTISLLTFIFFFMVFVDLPAWKKAIMVAVVLPIAVLTNALRICSVAVAGHHFGADVGNTVHDWSGYPLLFVAFMFIFALARWLGWKR
ncbi:MAG: exosortase/archaeosortase family protein [Armatimonadetes bacterium]|nr:exosortase/archaeosortase family protein [Armatimonadota bacterium]